MAASYKYDWPSVKVKYFESKTNGLEEFLRQEFGKDKNLNAGTFRKNTQGWYSEKQAFLRQVQAVAIQRAAQKAAKVYEPNMTELGEMHRANIQLQKAILSKLMEDTIDPATGKVKSMPDVKILETLWKMTKAEKREPTEVGEIVETVTPEDDARIKNLIAHVRGRK